MGTAFDASLDAVELDLLCKFAGVAAPFPLRVRASGATGDERLALFALARQRLAARGLADQDGPLGVAAIFVRLLRTGVTVLDLMLSIRERQLGAVLLGHQGEAVLAVADPDDAEPTARLVALPLDDAVDELLLLVPELDAPRITPFTLPRPALAEVYLALLERKSPLDTHELDELLRAHGIDDRLANRMVSQLQPVLGSGQCGLAERGGYAGEWRRFGEELRWLDTDYGRLRLAGTNEWTSVNPLFANDLAAEIRRLASSVGG